MFRSDRTACHRSACTESSHCRLGFRGPESVPCKNHRTKTGTSCRAAAGLQARCSWSSAPDLLTLSTPIDVLIYVNKYIHVAA